MSAIWFCKLQPFSVKFVVPLQARNCEILQAPISYLSVCSSSRLCELQRETETGSLLSCLHFPLKQPVFIYLGIFVSGWCFKTTEPANVFACIFTPPSSSPRFCPLSRRLQCVKSLPECVRLSVYLKFNYLDFRRLGNQ